MKIDFTGVVKGVYIGASSSTLETTPQPEVEVSLEGFAGDKHAGMTLPSNGRTPFYPRGTEIRNQRQVTILSEEELAIVAAEMDLPEIRTEWLGGNLLVTGIPNLTLLPPGSRLFFSSGTTLIATGENLPCGGPGAIIQSRFPDRLELSDLFRKSALHRRGIVATVERSGRIQVADQISVRLMEQPPFPA